MASGFYELTRQKMLNPDPRLKITGATNATPINITAVGHGLATSDVAAVVGVLGNTAANGVWTITVTGVDNFTLNTSVGSGSYTANTGEVLLTDTLLQKCGKIVRWGTGTAGGGNRDAGDVIKAMLVNVSGAGTLYTVDLAANEFLSSIPSGARLSTSAALTAKTSSVTGPFVGGVLDAADITFTAVGPGGTTIEALVFYKDTGDATTSPLILYLDTANVTGLPFTANGTDVPVTWDNTATRIAKI